MIYGKIRAWGFRIPEEAEKLIKYYMIPIHENTARANQLKNGFRGRIKKLNLNGKNNLDIYLSPDFRETFVSERFLVQYLGESEAEILKLRRKKGLKTGERKRLEELITTTQGIRNDLEEGMEQKIDHAIGEFKSIYKEIHPMLNKVLVQNGYPPIGKIEGYFPHFLEDGNEGLLKEIGKKLGFDVDNKELPTDIAGLTSTFRPGKRFSMNLLKRNGTNTEFDAVKGFDRYIESIADIIYHTEDIQKLRALENRIRFKYSDAGTREEIKRHMNHDALTEAEKQANILAEYDKVKVSKLPHFVTELRTYTDLLAGKKHGWDRGMENALGRRIYSLSKALENRIAANMVAVNPGSWLTNFIPITQAAGEIPNKRILKGMKDTIKSFGMEDDIERMSAFIINRKGSELLSKNKLDKLAGAMSSPMKFIDQFTAGALVQGKFYENLAKGMDKKEAIQNADQFAASVIADRSKGALPTLFESRNPIMKVFTMFQVEQNNQLSYLFKDLPRNQQGNLKKTVFALSKILVGAYIYNDLYENLTGRRSALDPFAVMNEAIGDFTGKRVKNVVDWGMDAIGEGEFSPLQEVEQKKVSNAVWDMGMDTTKNLPFVGGFLEGGRFPVQSAFPNLKKMVTSGVDWRSGEMNPKKAKDNIMGELLKTATLLGPPVGGGQVKKAIEGIGTMKKGGSYSVDKDGRERLEFAVNDKSPLRYAQAATFGKYSIPEAKEYIESGFKKLSANDTQKYHEAIAKTGISPKKYLDTLKRMKTVTNQSQERKILMNS